MKLINLHKQWMEIELLPYRGLCDSIPIKYRHYLKFFHDNPTIDFWGYGKGGYNWYDIKYAYTPLRQTIVLLICAMEGEL